MQIRVEDEMTEHHAGCAISEKLSDQANKGSRELDEAIATAIWGEPRPSGNVGCPRTLVWWHNGLGRSVAPEFTTSLNAALTLVPEGWWWGIASTGEARIWEIEKPGQFTAKAASPAMAICSAALKARAAALVPPEARKAKRVGGEVVGAEATRGTAATRE
jgi:hypothetical protein